VFTVCSSAVSVERAWGLTALHADYEVLGRKQTPVPA